jgi:hypothetical protein
MQIVQLNCLFSDVRYSTANDQTESTRIEKQNTQTSKEEAEPINAI